MFDNAGCDQLWLPSDLSTENVQLIGTHTIRLSPNLLDTDITDSCRQFRYNLTPVYAPVTQVKLFMEDET